MSIKRVFFLKLLFIFSISVSLQFNVKAYAIDPDWYLVSPVTPSPSPRYSAAMAYDINAGNFILFGGSSGNNETWSFNANTLEWTNLTPNPIPQSYPVGRTGASMAYDYNLAKIIMFGGQVSTDNYLNDTWAYDQNSGWQQIVPNPSTNPIPSARFYASMAFDSNSNPPRMILFGGANTSYGNCTNDTWTFDGANWNLLIPNNPDSSLYPRYSAVMTFDSTSNQIVLFGGLINSSVLGDTWGFNGSTWNQLYPTNPPLLSPSSQVGLYGASMVYNSELNTPVLFGGLTQTGQTSATWQYASNNWKQYVTTAAPSGLYYATMGFDVTNNRMILFGGSRNNFTQTFNQTWFFSSPQAPLFTSDDSFEFTSFQSNTFKVSALAIPTATITYVPGSTSTEQLPSGVSFKDNNDGTGTLSGEPETDNTIDYHITFIADNKINPPVTQIFTLTVNGPAISTGPVEITSSYQVAIPQTRVNAKKNVKLFNFVNVIKWKAPRKGGKNVVAYRIYRNKKMIHPIAEISSDKRLVFRQGGRSPDKIYHYYLVAVGSSGEMSRPTCTRIKGLNRCKD